MSAVAIIITSTTQPGRRDDLFELYQQHLAPRAEANDDQRFVAWCSDAADDDRFHLFELYSDADALGANAGADWFAEYMAAAGPLLAGEPVVTMASPRWVTGLADPLPASHAG